MAANRRLGQARLAGASGNSRNAPETPIRPTEGRVLPSRGRVALLGRYTASPKGHLPWMRRPGEAVERPAEEQDVSDIERQAQERYYTADDHHSVLFFQGAKC